MVIMEESVSIFSFSGKLRSFGTRGYGQRQFINPHGVAVARRIF